MADRQFCTFYLDEALFGIDIMLVREINRQLDMTPVHHLPAHIRGLLNLRGQIITVLDTGMQLGLGPRTITPHSRSLILKFSDEAQAESMQHAASIELVGLLVDRVGDVVRVHEGDIERPPANVGDVSGKFLTGVVKLDRGLLSLVKVKEICA